MHWMEMRRNIKDVVGRTGLALGKDLLVETIVTAQRKWSHRKELISTGQ